MSKIKLAIFDMDGTLLQPRSCWAQIHEHFGTDNSDMLKLYVEHKISDQEFVRADINTWEENSDVKVDEKYVNSILDKIAPIDGAEELVAGLHKNGIETIFLTGGIQFLADKWAKQWNMKKPLENVAAIGDTVVDLPMFERAGLSIAVNTNQSDVFENADYHHNGDLRELINIISKW